MRVLISGAGIAGPTLAYFLSKTGAEITIVEKAADFLDQGQNIDINGSAVVIAKKMGILERIRQLNTTETGTQFVKDDGKPFATFPIADNRPSMTAELEILRGDLAGVIYEATKQMPNIQYRFNTTITTVVSNDDQLVKVCLSNGATEEYDLLVAADGQWSRIRKQCFPASLLEINDTNMYAIYFTIPRQPSDDNMWNWYHALDSRILSIRPDPHGTMRTCMTYMPNTAADKEAWQLASRSG